MTAVHNCLLCFYPFIRWGSWIAARYHIAPIAVHSPLSVDDQAARHGAALWGREPNRCCAIRKVRPQRAFLAGYQPWITGIRRDQASTRLITPVVSWDAQGGLVKIAPLVSWTDREVWAHIRAHEIPYNYASSVRLEALANAIRLLLVLWRDEREADETSATSRSAGEWSSCVSRWKGATVPDGALTASYPPFPRR
ncbi:MAG: phosphoadenosine phosphosulfate reductase family protein [Chloroflexota bacterium]